MKAKKLELAFGVIRPANPIRFPAEGNECKVNVIPSVEDATDDDVPYADPMPLPTRVAAVAAPV